MFLQQKPDTESFPSFVANQMRKKNHALSLKKKHEITDENDFVEPWPGPGPPARPLTLRLVLI